MRYLLFFLLLACGCKSKIGGMIPIYQDEYVGTTDQRAFLLESILHGEIVAFQASNDCLKDSAYYNSTAIIRLANSDTITVYTPCLQIELKTGDQVIIGAEELNDPAPSFLRNILVKPKRNSPIYPYWVCSSCKYPNTIASLTPAGKH